MPKNTTTQFTRRDGVRGKELFTFEEVAVIEPVDSHTYNAAIHVEFSHGPSAHGGFMIAILWKAVQTHFTTTLSKQNQPNTFSLHTEFLRPASTGPVTITLRDVRIGKATSTVHATLCQSGIARAECYATNCGPLAIRNTISIPMKHELRPLPPPIDFNAMLSGKDAHWIRYDVGRDPKVPNHTLCNVIFAIERKPPILQDPQNPLNRRITTQWMCPRIPEEKWTEPMLGLVMDHAVPTIENFYSNAPHNNQNMPARAVENEEKGLTSYDHPHWASPRYYPTISMSIEVKRPLPMEGVKWLMLRWHTKECVDGRFDIEADVLDAEGRLVAVAQSLWYVIDMAGTDENSSRKKIAEGKGIREKYDSKI